MSSVPSSVRALLNTLNRQYGQQLPGKIQLVEQMWNKLVEKCSYDEFRDLQIRVHSLAGSSALIGNAAVFNIARALEGFLDKLLDVREHRVSLPDTAQRTQISAYMQALKEAGDNGLERIRFF
ncbi:MAG: hypothetical protein ABIR48_00105 [Gammaproteobacteria bacterium]